MDFFVPSSPADALDPGEGRALLVSSGLKDYEQAIANGWKLAYLWQVTGDKPASDSRQSLFEAVNTANAHKLWFSAIVIKISDDWDQAIQDGVAGSRLQLLIGTAAQCAKDGVTIDCSNEVWEKAFARDSGLQAFLGSRRTTREAVYHQLTNQESHADQS